MRDPNTKLAVPHPKRAPLVREMFERYAVGQESDRTLAAWLNAKGALSARGRQFGKDTIRDMLCNAAYAGYVTGLRDQSRAIKGLHDAIVPEALFDRVQEIRAYRATFKQPSPPSDEYLLRKLLRCERCGGRMHGTRGSRPPIRRYLCATRRHGEAAPRRSPRPSRSRTSSSTGYADSNPTRTCATSSSTPSPAKQKSKATTPLAVPS